MRYLGLALASAAVWLAVWYAVRVTLGLVAAAEGAEAPRVSWLGSVTAPPLLFTALAYAVDRARGSSMGLWVVLGVHVVLGLAALAFGLRGRALARRSHPPAGRA